MKKARVFAVYRHELAEWGSGENPMTRSFMINSARFDLFCVCVRGLSCKLVIRLTKKKHKEQENMPFICY